MNPHRVNYYQELGQTLTVPNGWVLIEALSNLDKTKKFLGDIKDGLAKLEAVKKDVAEANAENNKLANRLQAEQEALDQRATDIDIEKARHASNVEALRPRLDTIAERERQADIEAENLTARKAALDSREGDLAKIRIELDQRAADLKTERSKLEAKYAGLQAAMATVQLAEGSE